MSTLVSIPISLLLMFTSWSLSMAADLSQESLHGKWLFTKILMDGTTEMQVNRYIEFLPNGEVINYDAAGSESSRASFEINGDRVIYTDDKGSQKWKVISIEQTSLHVDHRGAEMFFERE